MDKKRLFSILLTILTGTLLIWWQVREFIAGEKMAFIFVIIFAIITIDHLYKTISDEAYAEELEKGKKVAIIYKETFGKFAFVAEHGFYILLLIALIPAFFPITKVIGTICLSLIGIAIIYQIWLNSFIRKKLEWDSCIDISEIDNTLNNTNK